MNNQEMINRISHANDTARKLSLTLIPVMRDLSSYTTPDLIIKKNMDLADSLMKFINDSEELQAMLQQVEEVA